MNKADQIIRLFVFIYIFFFCYYFLFNYQYAFNYELENNGQYLSVFLSFTSLFLFLTGRFLSKKILEAKDIIILTAINAFALLLLNSQYYSFSNEYFANVTVSIIFFSILLWADEYLLHAIVLVFILLFLYQIGLALQQMGWFSLRINRLNITGSLRNSGIFSCYLVLQIPFFYYSLFRFPARFFRTNKYNIFNKIPILFFLAKLIFFLFILLIVILIVLKSESRTALIALATLTSFFIFFGQINRNKGIRYKWPKFIKPLTISVLAILITGSVIYLFRLKKLSTSGRILMFDVATEHLREHYFLGTGIGRFTWHYPQWQAQYFSTHPIVPIQYFLSAGESYIIMNEYLQLLETLGAPGIFVCLIILLWFFCAKSTKHQELLLASKQTMMLILLCGFTSYPFHVNIILLLMMFCFATAAAVQDTPMWLLNAYRFFKKIPAAALPGFMGISIFISGYTAYSGYGRWKAKCDWDHLRNDLNNSRAEIKKQYRLLEPSNKYDGKFLTDYGEFLVEDSADCPEAISVLQAAKKYFISRETIEALAIGNKKIKNYGDAIDNYAWLCNYLPNRFGSKLALLKLYIDARDTVNARKISHVILTMPVKIHSYEVDRIKQETESIMK